MALAQEPVTMVAGDEYPIEPAPAGRAARFATPRAVLVLLDGLAICLAWVLALGVGAGLLDFQWEHGVARSWVVVGLSVLLTVVLLVDFDLYKSRVSSVRSAELAGISRVGALVMPGVLLFDLITTNDLHLAVDLTAGFATFGFLVIARSIYDGWIRSARKAGRFCRTVVLVGGGAGTLELKEMLEDHEEAGYRVRGIVGPRCEHLSPVWLAPTEDILEAMAAVGANGAFVIVDELPPRDRRRVVEELVEAGHHVHLTMGIAGMSSQRLQLAPVVHEPLLYVGKVSLQRWQLFAKRALDVFVAGLVLLLALPVLLVSAIVIKLQDRGPILFKQERVGQQGRPFKLWKLRTMVVDAEERLHEVAGETVRQGPLLKVQRDPRVTRVGHFLRSTSIDELPQLWNVLRGDMSTVGPRPALPHEVAAFDDELLERHNVRPGITGLWQVEARDNPSFSSYRRLDLFYVKNWSISLDLVILVLTAQSVVSRALRSIFDDGEDEAVGLS